MEVNLFNDNIEENIHLIKDDNCTVLLHIPSLTFYKLKESLAEAVGSEEHIDEQLQSIVEELNTIPASDVYEENFNKLRKVVLLLEQDCNLSCKYCYANGGKYESDCISRMDEQKAVKALEALLNRFSEGIESVQMFGGEPLLNFNGMMSLTNHICRLCTEKGLPLPVFGIVTNGTLITPEIIDFFNLHNYGVTISIDGPKEIHDSQRVYRNNEGTFDIINQNVSLMNMHRKFPLFAEITLTKLHLEKLKSQDDVIRFIESIRGMRFDAFTFGFAVDLPEEYGITEENMEVFKRVCKWIIDYSLESMFTDRPFIIHAGVFLIGKIIKNKASSYPCRAGLRNFTVNSKGEILPCYLFYGKKEYCVKLRNNEETQEAIEHIKNKFMLYNMTSNINDCSKCWMRNACFTRCPGFSSILYNNMSRPHAIYCAYGKLFMERILVYLTKNSDDKEKMKLLNKNLKTFQNMIM